ncbi:MAG TPA: hypothetical protein VNH18_26530, partial [Bryobacteraceae bacterium]|nr:hypothetical protein [Bryobacteraceae bacterium]
MWKTALPSLLIFPAALYAQGGCTAGVQISPAEVVRQSSIRVTLTTPPKNPAGKIAFVRTDQARIEDNLAFDGATAAYNVPAAIPLGRTRVEIQVDGRTFPACELLTVKPASGWQVHLSAFEPPGTSNITDGRDGAPDRIKVTLRGTGFDTGRAADNRITINGAPLEVTWDACDAQKPQVVFAQLVSADRIDLCHVPIPAHERLAFRIRQGDNETELRTFRVFRWSFSKGAVAAFAAAVALTMGLIVLALLKMLSWHQSSGSSQGVLDALFVDPETDSYSLSKFQFYCWTVAAVFGYCYLVLGKMVVQGLNWPDMPEGLPAIIAIGAGTSVGAQFVSNVRGPKGSGSERPSLGDLVSSGGVAAPERVQFFVWTVIGVAVFCVSVLKYTPDAIQTLDPVPSGLLMMMGLSSAGYLGGKLARKPGPIINEISITPSESDDEMAKKAFVAQPPPNLSQPAAQAQSVLQTLAGVPEGNAKKAVDALNAAYTAISQVKTAHDGELALTKLAAQQQLAESAALAAAGEFALPGAPATAAKAAELAQRAAAALQDLAGSATSIVATSLAPALPDGTNGPRFTRVIEIRGQNLSSEAIFEIAGADLPFRMLADKDGKR